MQDCTAMPDVGGAAPLTGRGVLWLTGAGASLIAVCYGLARFAYGLFVPAFRAEFGLDAAAAGAIASGSYAAYCVAIVISTAWTPRFGGRAVAVAAGCIATIGCLLIAVASNAAVLAIGVVVAGASTGVVSPPLAHAVAHAVAVPLQSRTQTVVNAGTGVGVAVAGPIALLANEQWRAAWVAFAVLGALSTAGVAMAVPAGPAGRSGGTRLSRAFLRGLVPRGSGRLLVASALMGAASAGVWTFGRDLLVTVGGMSERSSTIAWILLGAFGMLGAIAGDLARRVGLTAAWLATMLTMAAATGLLAAFPADPALVWAAAAAFGAAYLALTGLLLIWGARLYPWAPVTGVGLAFLLTALGQAAGAPVIGALSEPAGPRAAFAAAGLLAVLGGLVRPRHLEGSGH